MIWQEKKSYIWEGITHIKQEKLKRRNYVWDGRTYNKYTFKIGVGEQGITVAIKPVTDSYIPS